MQKRNIQKDNTQAMGVGGVLMGFGERLRKCREKENLTQKELGLILGVSGNSIGNYEKGTSYPSADILCKIFSALRCDANYLFKDNLPTVPVNSVDSFGDRIRLRRKELGLSVDDIADALGIHRSTVYRYESDEVEKLPISALEPLSHVLKTTPAKLLGFEDSALKISESAGTNQDCFFVADLSPEERETIELMRSNSEARAQIMLAKDMCKEKQQASGGLSCDERETIELMRKNIEVRAQIMLVQRLHKHDMTKA